MQRFRLVLAFLIPASMGCTAILGDFQLAQGIDAASGAGDAESDGPMMVLGEDSSTGIDATADSALGDSVRGDGSDATIVNDSAADVRPDEILGADAAGDDDASGSDANVGDAKGYDSGVADVNSADVRAPDTIVFTQSPLTGIAGAALSTIGVSVVAPDGTVDTQYTGAIVFGFAATPTPGTAALGGVLSTRASNGVATFSGVTISQAGTYAFMVTSGSIVGTSPVITVSPAVGSWQVANGTVVGGDVRSIAVSPTDPNVAYAGTNGGGIYMTTNGTTSSASWSFAGLAGKSVGTVVFDPTNAKTIYAAADGVYKSIDTGSTWQSVTAGFSNIYVQALTVDPTAPTTLYFGCALGGYKSTDAGQTWTRILGNVDGGGLNVTAIAVAPTSPRTVYAGVYGELVHQSTDGGMTWAALPGVFGADAGAALWYRKIAVDPTDPMVPYVGFENPASGQGGVWKFAGGAWTLLSGLSPAGNAEAIVLNSSGQTSYIALYGDSMYTSTDGGASWAAVGSAAFSSVPIAVGVAPSLTSVAYAVHYTPSDGHMMYVTTTGGAGWIEASAGIHAYNANSVAVAPSNPSIVYLGGGYNGIHRSTDGARTWTTLPGTTPQNWGGDFYVGVSSTNANVLYVGNNGGGIFQYSDASSASLGVQVEPGVTIMALAVAASDDRSVYAAAFPGANGGAYVTANGGMTWANPMLTSALGYGIAIDPSNASVAYIGLGNGALKTTDHGATWTPLIGIGSFVAMAIDPTNTLSLYTGNGGVAHSSNGGSSWVSQTAGLPSGVNASAMAIDPKTPTIVYAGFDKQGIWRTTNGGTTWAQLGLAGWTPKAIAIDPSTPTTIYVGVASGGLYKTTSGGQ